MASSTTIFKNLSPAELFSSSLPTPLLPSKHLSPFISFASSKPKPPTLFLFSSISFPINKKHPHVLTPLVAQTSDWAPEQEEEAAAGLSAFVGEGEEEEAAAGLSAFEGEGEGEGGGVVLAEGEDAFVEGESGDENFEVGDEVEYPEPPEDAKLFVGNLPYDVDSQRLAKMFEKAGVVEVAEVIYNRETDQSRGFGFVTMRTVEEAEKAVEMLHRYDVNGRLLTVNKATPRGSRPDTPAQEFEPSFRIYVGNLPWQVDDARLEQVFSEHGKVKRASVVYDRETGRSRGFGFVTMATQTELDDAIAALDGQSLDGRALRVNVAEEKPRRTF